MESPNIYSDISQIPLVLKVDDLANILQVGRSVVYELIRSGQIQSIRVGYKIRIPRHALIQYLGESA